jgi:flagellar biosynthesis/type III secretory pathway chaperone
LAILKDILQKELSVFQDLLKLEEKTYRLLIEGGAKELISLNLQKENLLQKVDRLEKERKNLVPAGITLQEYIEENPPGAEELRVLKKLLLQVHTSLKRMQKINRHLLSYNLSYIRSVIDAISPQKREILYAPSGEMQQNPISTGILDSNV